MQFRLGVFVAALWIAGGASVASAQFGVGVQIRYTCAPGRFRISYSKGKTWHYCFDEKYYSEKTLPADLRSYFEKVDREHKESIDKFHQDWAAAEADRTARGLPTMAELHEKNRERAAGLRAQVASGRRTSGGSPVMGRATGIKTGGGVEVSSKPEAEPIMPAALLAVTQGATAAEVLDAIGDPPGRVSTGDGAESWTYVLTNGAFAKIRMEAGRVKEIVLPN